MIPMQILDDPNFYYLSVNEIIPGIWLGNYAASQDINFLNHKKIEVIFNCSKHIPFPKIEKILKYNLCVDDPGEVAEHTQDDVVIMKKHLGRLTKIMNHWHSKGKPILVHCHAGMQRSAALMMAYLIRYHYKPVLLIGSEKYTKVKKSTRDSSDLEPEDYIRFNNHYLPEENESNSQYSIERTNKLSKEESFNKAYKHIMKKRSVAFHHGRSVNFRNAIWSFMSNVAKTEQLIN